MDRSHYIHVHLPGRGRLTLSLPSGVERAIISGKLTADAQVWYEQLNLWVSISRHPRMASLLSLVQLPTTPPSPRPEAPELFDLELPQKVEAPAAIQSQDPDQLPLIVLEEVDEYREFSEFLRRSSQAEERRVTVRRSGAVRSSGPARVVVAGAAKPKGKANRLRGLIPSYLIPRHLVPRYLVPRWAATVALTLLSSLALGLFLFRSSGESGQVTTVMRTNALSANGRGLDSSGVAAALAEPNPLDPEERELETNLRIAEAVIWQPAIDFSAELIWRSARKVDAVRNSISLYRIGAWRQIDSAIRDTSSLLEPYEEAVRVDEVLSLVQSAVTVLDSAITTFRINGEVLVFSHAGRAARYSWLRHRADSLLRTPVAADSTPLLRAPRRVVSRLVETLPTAIVQAP
jgi:hypothetical protein